MVGPEQLQSYVRGNVLNPNEELLWQGRGKPPTTLKFRWLGERPQFIALGWIGFLFAALAFALNAPLAVTLPVALVGLWFAGGALRDSKHLSRSFYFITDQRAFRVEVGQRVKIDERPHDDLHQAEHGIKGATLSYSSQPELSFRYTTDAERAVQTAQKQIRKPNP